MSEPLSKEEMKSVFKEAMKEWLDEKFRDFGKWTALSIGAALLFAGMYFIFYIEGFKK